MQLSVVRVQELLMKNTPMKSKSRGHYAIHGFIPSKGDLIICNVDPSLGREIKKEHPGWVISSWNDHLATGFCVVCPITSTQEMKDGFIPLSNVHKVKGHINALQLKCVDFISKDRSVRFVEKATLEELGMAVQVVRFIFDFDELYAD
mgnify:CR=1 FL=1